MSVTAVTRAPHNHLTCGNTNCVELSGLEPLTSACHIQPGCPAPRLTSTGTVARSAGGRWGPGSLVSATGVSVDDNNAQADSLRASRRAGASLCALQSARSFPGTVQWRMMLGMVVVNDLSDAERRVWEAFPTGSFVEFGSGKAEEDDLAGMELWGPERHVRAEVLAALLCGAVEVEPGMRGGIHLGHVRVIGELNLAGATLKQPFRLHGCYVADGIDLSEATTETLDLRDCHVAVVNLSGAKVNGSTSFGMLI